MRNISSLKDQICECKAPEVRLASESGELSRIARIGDVDVPAVSTTIAEYCCEQFYRLEDMKSFIL